MHALPLSDTLSPLKIYSVKQSFYYAHRLRRDCRDGWSLLTMSEDSAGKTSKLRGTQWLGAGVSWRGLTSHVWGSMLAVAGTSVRTPMCPLHRASASSQHGG